MDCNDELNIENNIGNILILKIAHVIISMT